jgi:hypothetical protein
MKKHNNLLNKILLTIVVIGIILVWWIRRPQSAWHLVSSTPYVVNFVPIDTSTNRYYRYSVIYYTSNNVLAIVYMSNGVPCGPL